MHARTVCIRLSFSSSAQEPGNKAKLLYVHLPLSHLFARQNPSGQNDNLQPKSDNASLIVKGLKFILSPFTEVLDQQQ